MSPLSFLPFIPHPLKSPGLLAHCCPFVPTVSAAPIPAFALSCCLSHPPTLPSDSMHGGEELQSGPELPEHTVPSSPRIRSLAFVLTGPWCLALFGDARVLLWPPCSVAEILVPLSLLHPSVGLSMVFSPLLWFFSIFLSLPSTKQQQH